MSNLLADDLNHILDHTVALWNDVRGERIFISGGTGFVGRWLLESFAWANQRLSLGASAVVLTRFPEKFQRIAPHLAVDPAISLHAGNITQFELPTGTFSLVIHAAADMDARTSEQGASRLFQSIVLGTERMLEFAAGRNTRRFLLASSGAVYGRQPPDLQTMSEEYLGAPDLLNPSSIYGEGKRVAELFCTIYAYQHILHPTIARGFAFFGPNMTLNGPYAIGNFLRDAQSGGPLWVKGDGSAIRSYLYSADMAIWLWTILLRGQRCYLYNVGSDQAMSIIDLARFVAGAWEATPDVRVATQANTNAPIDRYVPSTQRAFSDLGLTQTISFEEGMQRWIKFLRSQ